MKASALTRATVALVAGLTNVAGATGAATPATISTAHVEIATGATPETVVAGTTVTLALEIAPHDGIRVYAPGATGYKVVALTLEPQPFLRTLPVKYGASEIYFFKELNEIVPVYQKPFTVRQDVVLLSTPQAQTALRGKDRLSLTGVLDYQACDDQVCFIPVSVPVTWTVSIRPPVKPRGAAPRPR